MTIGGAVQGQLEVTTRAGTGKAARPDASGRIQDVVDSVPFIMLGLDLPPAPLYKDALEKNIIPQVLLTVSDAHGSLLGLGQACSCSCTSLHTQQPGQHDRLASAHACSIKPLCQC